MTLTPGTRIGPYAVLAPLGAGGMGEVYKARDTRLDRIVALKVLPAAFAADPQARERFEREARAVAALNHPHICTLHDIGRHVAADGSAIDFLVMEHLEGETLAARLEKGPLPLELALACASQIASALDRAHRAGIVHRDIKPANIMLTKTGTARQSALQAKLLDFGIAKPAVATHGETTGHVRRDLTDRGLVLGTVQYMAPEQLHGRAVDVRTDIFAFGAVLYEMVTGRKAFEGGSQASVIAAIMERDPPRVSAAQPLAPATLDHLVATCLEKDPDERWQTARDVLHELKWVTDVGTPVVPPAPVTAGTRRPARWLAAAAVASIAASALGMTLWRAEPARPIRDVRFSVYPEHGTTLSTPPASVLAPQFALSHDGSSLAFVAISGGRARLWVRRLDALAARVLPGTEDAIYPFWSPDGRSLGFFAQGKLKVVSLDGGTAVVVTDASFDTRGGAWAPDGTMLINLVANSGLARVSAGGRTDLAVPVNQATGETSLRWPAWLPDSRHFLAVSRNLADDRRGIYLGTIDGPSRSLLVHSDWGAAAVDGRVLFLRGPTLMAQALDLGQERLTGEPVALLDGVGATTTGYSAFSVSFTGTLAYSEPWPTRGELVWFDRAGRQIGAPVAQLADYVDFSLSPDAGHLAVSRVDAQTNTSDVWLLDFARRVETRLTSDRLNDAGPQWSPDASRIYFRSNRRGLNSLYAKPANGSRPEELVFEQVGESASSMMPSSLGRDGSRLLFSNSGLRSSFDVWELSMSPTPEAKPILQSAFNEHQAVFSPDGRWIAFVSDEAGPLQVWVHSYPGGNQRQQVSSRGGSDPQWRADGRELFFLGEGRVMMAAPFAAGEAGVPVPLFRTRVPVTGNPYRVPYAVSPDGQRFLVNTAPEDTPPPTIQIVLDWRALLPAETR